MRESLAKERGTFAAVRDKIPYLKELGVTTVEFMPVYEFEELILKEKAVLPEYISWQVRKEDQIKPEDMCDAGACEPVGICARQLFCGKGVLRERAGCGRRMEKTHPRAP